MENVVGHNCYSDINLLLPHFEAGDNSQDKKLQWNAALKSSIWANTSMQRCPHPPLLPHKE